MQIIGKEKSLQSIVLDATVINNFIVLIFCLVVTLFGITIPSSLLIYINGPIALAGLCYDFFLFNRVSGRLPYMSSYIAISFVMLQYFVVISVTGGFTSPYYGAWLLILTMSCVLGIRAWFINIFLAASGFLLSVGILSMQNGHFEFNVISLGLNVVAILFGAFIAVAFEQFKQATSYASRISNQIDSTQFSEKLMLASIADPVVGIDNERKIVLMNIAAEDMFGWDLKSATGVYYLNVMKLRDGTGNEITNANDPFLQVFEQKNQLTTDAYSVVDKQNNKIAVSMSIAPTVDVNNEISGAIAVLHDISDQKALQRERNEFVSTASHEMRTPVAAIEGYISMATNPNLATIDERGKNFLDKAHNSAVHLGKLFQDLLSVTKIEDQRLQDHREIFNLSDVVSQISSEMEMVASRKGLKLYTHIGKSANLNEAVVAPMYMVNADSGRIREVITNLVDNAIKYTPKGSVEMELTGDKNNVTLRVRDTGMGIAPDDLRHMFEKFYRVNNSLTRDIGGTGLGLYIARSLVEMYGGKMFVESKLGEGSTFGFSLPLAKK
jgi:PAS domain S-box-containing protein